MKVQAAAWLQSCSQDIGIQCCATLTHLRSSCNISALASQIGVFVCSLSCLQNLLTWPVILQIVTS